MLCQYFADIHFRLIKDCPASVKEAANRWFPVEADSLHEFSQHAPSPHDITKYAEAGCHFCMRIVLNDIFGDETDDLPGPHPYLPCDKHIILVLGPFQGRTFYGYEERLRCQYHTEFRIADSRVMINYLVGIC